MDLFSGEKYLIALQVVKKLKKQGYQAVFAGGCVRDAFLKTGVKDYDIATSATPEDVIELFENTNNIGQRFASIFVEIEDEMVDVTTFRTDGPYTDGRHPDFVHIASHREDVLRRDFTINALYYDPLEKQIIDWVGGVDDLSARLVRTIGSAEQRFKEDRLRMLRAIRFTTQFNFELEESTAQAIHLLANQIMTVSHERLSQELQLLLLHSERLRGVQLLKCYGLLSSLLPECHDLSKGIQQALVSLAEPDFIEVLAVLLMDLSFQTMPIIKKLVQAVSFRLRLSNHLQEKLEFILSHFQELKNLKNYSRSQLRQLLARKNFQALLKVFKAYEGDIDLLQYIEEQRQYHESRDGLIPPLFIQGKDLIQLGLSPGPLFSEIIKHVQYEQLEGHLTSKAEALDYVRNQWLVY